MTSDEARERMPRHQGADPARLARDSAPVREARRLARQSLKGALATLEAGTGYPYASLVIVATDPAGHPLLLLSALALHARNLAADARASLLLDATSPRGDPLAGGRITLVGRIGLAPAAQTRTRFLARHPEAAAYADFADFAFHRLTIERGHFVGGFGRIVDIPAPLLTADETAAAAVAGAEPALIAELGPLAPAIAARLGEAVGDWRITGLDPEGVDLRSAERTARALFQQPAATPAAVRGSVQSLA